jgi:hypothetical protein
VRGAHLCHRQLVQLHTGLFRFTHESSHRAMRLAERRTLAHEIVGQVGCHHRARHRRAHARAIKAQLGHRTRHGRQHERQRIHGVEQCALVVLQVLAVAARQPLERGHQ